MAYFQVILSGIGISLPVEGSEPAIGFFTTRTVRARDREQAEFLAKEMVLSEWRTNGTYAKANTGGIPSLTVTSVTSIGLLKGVFSRKRTGYAFYLHED